MNNLKTNAVTDEEILKLKIKQKKKNARKFIIISATAIITFIIIWEILTDVLKIFPSYALPSPYKIASSFITKLTSKAPDNGTLFQHIWASLQVALSGYALGVLIGVPLGICMAWFSKFNLIATPLFDLIRPIPTIAWIPMMILWFGIGLGAKAAIVFMSAFVPCVINTYSGIKSTSQVHLWVSQTFGASRWQMLKNVAFPTALPYIFTGMRVSLGSAWTSLCAAEMLAASQGLGFMIQLNRQLARADLIIVGMLTIGGVGAFLSFILGIFERNLVKGVARNE